jgi:hypothetical protein
VFGQPALSEKTEQEVKDMLCHKWQPVSVEEDGKTIPMEKEDSVIYIIFLKDGTFIDYFEGNSPSNKWTYNHKTKTVTTAHEAKKIVSLNAKELVLMYKVDGSSSIITMRRID